MSNSQAEYQEVIEQLDKVYEGLNAAALKIATLTDEANRIDMDMAKGSIASAKAQAERSKELVMKHQN